MRFFGGFLAAFALITLAALLVILSGAYNVAAIVPETALERGILHSAMRYSVQARAREELREVWSESQLREGFKEFDGMCIVCHGAPGKERSDIGKGLRPQPPNLAEVAQGWTSGQLFWIIKNGVKMTGMPAFGVTHDDKQLWSIVGFVRRLPRTSAQEYEMLEKQLSSRSDPQQNHEH